MDTANIVGSIDNLNALPYLALIAAMSVTAASLIIVFVSHYCQIPGSLVISVLIAVGFITATYASMIYDIKQTPLTEILVGGLATALGGVVAHWMGR